MGQTSSGAAQGAAGATGLGNLPPPAIPPITQQENIPPPPAPPNENLQLPPAPPQTVPMPTVTVPRILGVPTTPPPSLTLDQVIERVLAVNPTIQLSRNRLQLAQEQIRQGESYGYPQINASAADTYYGSPTTAGPGSVEVPNVEEPTTIPTITDAAQGETFTGSGGTLGTTTTQVSSSSGGTGSSATTTTGTGATTVTTPATNPGLTPTTTNGTGTTGTGTTTPIAGGGTGTGTGTGTTTGQFARPSGPGSPSAPSDDPLLDQYAAAMQQQSPAETANPGNPDQAPRAASGNGNNGGGRTWHNANGAGISLSQLVDVFGLVGTGVSVLREMAQFYQIDLDREMNEEALTVKDTFFQVINAQNDVASAQEQVNNATATYNDALAQYTAGVEPQFDVISAETQLSNAQEQLLTAQNELNTQQANLDNLMGYPAGTAFTLVSPPMPGLSATYDQGAEIAKAYASRPEMHQVHLDEDIAHKLVRLAEAGYLPTVAIGADLDYVGQVAGAGESHYTEDITAQVSMPIFNGGLTAAQVSEAKTNAQTEQTTEVQLRQNIALEVQAALINLQNATALVQADETTVTESTDSLRLAQLSFRAGVGTLLDVENAVAQLAIAQEELSQAEFQLQTSYASLVRAEGGR